jgi:peroxiredoxin
MTRCLAVMMLAFALAAGGLTHAGGAKGKDKDKDFVVKGTLTKDDPKDAQRNGPSQVHVVKLKAGKAYTIDMLSSAFDSYLRLLDPKGMQIVEDDDGGEGLNSRILFNCPTDGDYKIVTTTFGAGAAGEYTLTVKLTGGVQQSSSGHSQMLGKAAPDFTGDIALNGKAGKLSDLKGKVVLLYFWEPRSSSSAALFPKLAEWHKKHAATGLAVVGVTFFVSDIGDRLVFDKETGGVKTSAKADRKSDETMLSAFVKHHKLDHLQLVLDKKNALKTFDTYIVNGLPQVVLIDRKGIVRFIDVNGEKNSAQVEKEMQKVLAEK